MRETDRNKREQVKLPAKAGGRTFNCDINQRRKEIRNEGRDAWTYTCNSASCTTTTRRKGGMPENMDRRKVRNPFSEPMSGENGETEVDLTKGEREDVSDCSC